MKFKFTAKTVQFPDHIGNGAAIRQRRLQTEISLRRLASMMGWSASYQSDIELGKRALSPDKFAQILAFLEAAR